MNANQLARYGTLAFITGLMAEDVYRQVIRPTCASWGATEEETSRVMPGDGIVPEPALATTHAVTIDAPPEAVWPWLAQMGPGRAGAYTYDWVENLFGLDMHSADRIVPDWQHMDVGDAFQLSPDGPPLTVHTVDPARLLILALADGTWSWVFALEPVAGERTRLLERNRFPVGRLRDRARLELLLPGAFLMERKMLLGIKARAERTVVEPERHAKGSVCVADAAWCEVAPRSA